jgi:hypothetical protein
VRQRLSGALAFRPSTRCDWRRPQYRRRYRAISLILGAPKLMVLSFTKQTGSILARSVIAKGGEGTDAESRPLAESTLTPLHCLGRTIVPPNHPGKCNAPNCEVPGPIDQDRMEDQGYGPHGVPDPSRIGRYGRGERIYWPVGESIPTAVASQLA